MTKKDEVGPSYPPIPVGWGEDFLTSHFQLAHENRYATLDNFEHQCTELSEIADALNSYWPTVVNPRPEASASLLMRAHLLFANVCETAYSTQVFASVVLARTALEAAGYSSLIAVDSEAEKEWRERNLSEASLKKARNYFTSTRIRDALNSHHIELASAYWRLYNTAIDFGAHPNIERISANSSVRQTEEGFLVEQLALTANRGLINFGLKIAFDVGCCVVARQHICSTRMHRLRRLETKWRAYWQSTTIVSLRRPHPERSRRIGQAEPCSPRAHPSTSLRMSRMRWRGTS